ncbi:hypothetical protein M0805_001921 [Coniferiporia weirii]|nr:hypothetical protein M0805_001921 [Coniferiporia weirii]
MNKVQKLGSAVQLIETSYNLRTGLAQIRGYFENTSKQERAENGEKKGVDTGEARRSRVTLAVYPTVVGRYIEALSKAITDLKRFTGAFAIEIMDFEDYSTGEEHNDALEGKYGATCHLIRFIESRANSLGVKLDKLLNALQRFEEIGIPCISSAQKRSTDMTLSAATVATLFASVAATALQYTINAPSSNLGAAVKALWFSSLVLSIGSAVTSMLAMTWRNAVFSSPKRELPWHIRIWINSGYLVLLVASVVAFLIGLVVYAFDSQKTDKITPWITAGLTVSRIVGLISVIFRLVKGRLNFSGIRHTLREKMSRIYAYSSPGWTSLRRSSSSGKGGAVLKVLQDNVRSYPTKEWIWHYLGRLLRVRDQKIRGDEETDVGGELNQGPSPNFQPPKNNETQSGEKQDDSREFAYREQITRLYQSQNIPTKGPVRHLRFSPDGRRLVACQEESCTVYELKTSFSRNGHIASQQQTVTLDDQKTLQFEWSASGGQFLLRTKDACFSSNMQIRGFTELTDVRWLDDDEILMIENRVTLSRMKLAGGFRTRYDSLKQDSEGLEVHSLYAVPGSDIICMVGEYKIEELPEEKDVRVYCVLGKDPNNFRDLVIRRRIPLLEKVNSLSFGPDSKNHKTYMLINYQKQPPELCTIDRDSGEVFPEYSVETDSTKLEGYNVTSDPGNAFIGPTKSIIACEQNGEILFWDLEKKDSLHTIRPVEDEEGTEERYIVSWALQLHNTVVAIASKDLPSLWTPKSAEDEEDPGGGTTTSTSRIEVLPRDSTSGPEKPSFAASLSDEHGPL